MDQTRTIFYFELSMLFNKSEKAVIASICSFSGIWMKAQRAIDMPENGFKVVSDRAMHCKQQIERNLILYSNENKC